MKILSALQEDFALFARLFGCSYGFIYFLKGVLLACKQAVIKTCALYDYLTRRLHAFLKDSFKPVHSVVRASRLLLLLVSHAKCKIGGSIRKQRCFGLTKRQIAAGERMRKDIIGRQIRISQSLPVRGFKVPSARRPSTSLMTLP